MRLIKFLFSQSRGVVLLAAGSGAAAALGTVVFLRLLNYALINAEYTDGPMIMGILGVSVLVTICRAGSQMLIIRLGQNAIYNLRLRLVRKTLTTPLRQLESLGSNQLIASLSSDTVALSGAIIAVPTIIINIITVIGVCVYVTLLDKGLYVLCASLCLLVASVGYYGPSKRSRAYFKRVRRDWDKVYEQFLALTNGIKELKVNYPRREAYLRNFESVTFSMHRNNKFGNYIQALAQGGGNITFSFFLVMALFLLPLYVRVDAHTLYIYLFVSFYLMGPVRQLMGLIPVLANAQVSLEKLEEMESQLDRSVGSILDEHSPPIVAEPLQPWESLELKNVVHDYQDEDKRATFTLGPVDLTFRRGELIFLTGGNGSGKTTLVKLLTGLYTPDGGEIYLGGRRITDENLEYYRRHFSIIFSDCYVFDTLIGLEGQKLDAKARAHLEDLRLADKVKVVNGKLSTTALSQGQRKRLALLACYIEDRPVYIFDEWAAEQDPFFREIFYTKILQELKAKGKTVVAISHDDRYYHLGDRIIKLDYGKVFLDEPSFDATTATAIREIAVTTSELRTGA
jgi:putative pyoverdin transport system ATP-binding/permease protein